MNLTTLNFPFKLHPALIPNFRAAIVEQIGLGHHLFHGHDNSEQGVTKYSNEYPLIRFAVRKGRAQLIGIGAGADAIIRHLLPVLPDTLVIAGQPCDTIGYFMKTSRWEPEVLPEYRTFGVHQWIALNKENYLAWKAHEHSEGARRLILDKCLTGHLRALAQTAGLDKEQRSRIVARVLRQDKVKRITWHRTKLVGFNVVAEANFVPPFGLGLGRCHSFGFGEVCSEGSYRALNARKRKLENTNKNDDSDGQQDGMEMVN
ncbi:MAG: hypothetical protein ACI81P_003646 [Neolewinella sp.]|jgi:hypothetical protein